MNELSTRPAVLSDAPALAPLCAELGYPLAADAVAARLARLAESADDAVLVAVGGAGELVGWIHVHARHLLHDESFVEIVGLVVTEARRGVGVGALLVTAGESWARGRGFSLMRVRSRVQRVEAHRFYEQRGYRRLKQQEVFFKSL